MKKTLFISLGLGLIAMVAVVLFVLPGMGGGLTAMNPSEELIASAVPFKGSRPHPLDGRLRVFLSDYAQTFMDKQQTSLARTKGMKMEWIPDSKPPSFRLRDEQGTRMLWRVEGQKAVCVEGQEFLAPDPYAEGDSQ